MHIRTLASRALCVLCREHVLQLCCISAASCMPSLMKVFATLVSVWKMFHYSPIKFSALKEMSDLVKHPPPSPPQLKMIKPSDTRWLAHDRSIKAIRRSMTPLIDTFEHRGYWRARNTWHAEDYENTQLCGDPDDAK